MELELWVIVLLAVVYFTAGFIDSIAGGGGLLTVPAFLLTGLPPEVVLGTNKLASCCGMLTALGNYARSGLVYWRALLTGVPAVILGGLICFPWIAPLSARSSCSCCPSASSPR